MGAAECGGFFSTNSGKDWTTTGGDIVHRYLSCLAKNGPSLFVGSDEGLWRRSLVEMIDRNDARPVDSGGIASGFALRQKYRIRSMEQHGSDSRFRYRNA